MASDQANVVHTVAVKRSVVENNSTSVCCKKGGFFYGIFLWDLMGFFYGIKMDFSMGLKWIFLWDIMGLKWIFLWDFMGLFYGIFDGI